MKKSLDFRLVLPKTIDNTYRGNTIPLAVFYCIILVTIVRSLIHMFSPDGGSMSIATIPINAYPTEAANTVVYLFGVWGLSQLIMGVFYLIVGLKYRALIPLMYIFITVEYAMRILIGQMKPIMITGTAPGAVANFVVVPLAMIMFFMSVYRKSGKESVKDE